MHLDLGLEALARLADLPRHVVARTGGNRVSLMRRRKRIPPGRGPGHVPELDDRERPDLLADLPGDAIPACPSDPVNGRIARSCGSGGLGHMSPEGRTYAAEEVAARPARRWRRWPTAMHADQSSSAPPPGEQRRAADWSLCRENSSQSAQRFSGVLRRRPLDHALECQDAPPRHASLLGVRTVVLRYAGEAQPQHQPHREDIASRGHPALQLLLRRHVRRRPRDSAQSRSASVRPAVDRSLQCRNRPGVRCHPASGCCPALRRGGRLPRSCAYCSASEHLQPDAHRFIARQPPRSSSTSFSVGPSTNSMTMTRSPLGILERVVDPDDVGMIQLGAWTRPSRSNRCTVTHGGDVGLRAP